MIDFNGTYTHNVDAKGRLSLPAKFRKKLPTDLVVRLDVKQQCLCIFDEEGFNEWVELFFPNGCDPLSERDTTLLRALKMGAEDVSQDSAGRIMLPQALREKVGIAKEVTLIGSRGYIEIWDAKRMEEATAGIDLSEFLHA